jgi:hypothetical protein
MKTGAFGDQLNESRHFWGWEDPVADGISALFDGSDASPTGAMRRDGILALADGILAVRDGSDASPTGAMRRHFPMKMREKKEKWEVTR